MSNTQTPVDNLHEFSVSELSQALKRHVEEGFSYVRVRGEISGLSRPASGHMYFGLKEEKTVIDGICWRGTAQKLAFQPEDGLEVICTGKLTTYPDRSKYQIVVSHMEPAGEGAMMALLEERKKKLAGEGLFDPARKKQTPYIPGVIGVITSPTGAVIRDILHRLGERFPRRVIVWPVKVQGEGAAEEVASAIQGFNAMAAGEDIPRPDVLIVARGGGSIEDLWAFNEEVVVRAAAASEIPLISAVGHETDTTLIDHASDLRAPTPTAAAEKAVPVLADLKYTVSDLDARMARARTRMFERVAERIKNLARALPRPQELLGLSTQRLDDLSQRLPRGLHAVASVNQTRLERSAGGLKASSLQQMLAMKAQRVDDLGGRQARRMRAVLDAAQHSMTAISRLLSTLSFERVLERGYAAIFDKKGKPVTSAQGLSAGVEFEVALKDGRVHATANGGAGHGPKKSPKSKRSPAKAKAQKPENKQGQLF